MVEIEGKGGGGGEEKRRFWPLIRPLFYLGGAPLHVCGSLVLLDQRQQERQYLPPTPKRSHRQQKIYVLTMAKAPTDC